MLKMYRWHICWCFFLISITQCLAQEKRMFSAYHDSLIRHRLHHQISKIQFPDKSKKEQDSIFKLYLDHVYHIPEYELVFPTEQNMKKWIGKSLKPFEKNSLEGFIPI